MRRVSRLLLPAVFAFGIMMYPFSPALCATAPEGSTAEKTEMPVKTVVLFSSGVGHFEHGGTVKGNSSVELRFKTGQINDILKSLVLEDLDGGKIGNIAYPSHDPIEKTLRSFQVDLTSNPPLADLLNQLRGSQVVVTVHSEQIDGTVLGLEKRRKTVTGQDNMYVDEWMFTILSGSAMRSVRLDDVQKIEIREPELERDLKKALAALSESRNQDKKPVAISFQGDGNRKVRLRYVIETPIWKTSYRLILPQKKAPAKLQGWAIVENQTDTDWNNVHLSLVSGRPVSFIEDLYKPIYVTRPVVEPELYKGLRPQNYEAGISAPVPPAPSAAPRGRAGGMAAERDMFRKYTGPIEDEAGEALGAAPFNPVSSIVSAASAEKVGELFQYTLANVSLPKLRSAMFPILTEDVAAERVSIFNPEAMPGNPLRGVLLHNGTDKHMMQGPITVFEGGTYAGDAQIGHVPPGQDRLLSYALDLEMQINSAKNREDNVIQTASIVKGVLNVSRKHMFSRDYVIQNKSDAERSLIVEHRFRPGWKLAGAQPIETTATHYRLKQTIPAGKTQTLTVVEEDVRGETIAIVPARIDNLLAFSSSGQIPKNVREILSKAVDMKRAIVDTENRVAEKRRTLEEIDREQERIRSNMGTVNNSSQYYSRLMEKLNAQETTIEATQSEIRELDKKLESQREELNKYLANLTVG